MKYYLILLLTLSSIGFISCTYADIVDEEHQVSEKVITYNSHIKTISYNYCITCHSGSAPSASLRLGTYKEIRTSAEDGTLLDRIQDKVNPMPPSGNMSQSEISQLLKWAEDGYPEG